MVDLYNQNMEGVDLSNQLMYSSYLTKVNIMAKKNCIQPSYTSSNEFQCNILYKLTMWNPKTSFKVHKRCH